MLFIAALFSVWEANKNRFRRLAYRIVGDTNVVDDVIQDVGLECMRLDKEGRVARDEEKYVVGMVWNRSVDAKRKRAQVRGQLSVDDVDEAVQDEVARLETKRELEPWRLADIRERIEQLPRKAREELESVLDPDDNDRTTDDNAKKARRRRLKEKLFGDDEDEDVRKHKKGTSDAGRWSKAYDLEDLEELEERRSIEAAHADEDD